MSQQERKKRVFEIDYDLDWEYSVEISQIRKDIDALEKLGATHVVIEGDSSYGTPYVTFNPTSERMETEEELKKRIAEEEEKEELIRRIELEYLIKLKEKYENLNK